MIFVCEGGCMCRECVGLGMRNGWLVAATCGGPDIALCPYDADTMHGRLA